MYNPITSFKTVINDYNTNIKTNTEDQVIPSLVAEESGSGVRKILASMS